MKLKKFILYSLLLNLFCVRLSKDVNIFPTIQSQILKKNLRVEKSENIVSYETVLESYYKFAIGNNENPTIDFDEFYESYYSETSDRDLYKYTLSLAEDNGNYEEVYNTLYSDEGIMPTSSGDGTGGGSSGGDADYILKNNIDYTSTPDNVFARKPTYSVYDYSSVQNGDIVWETDTAFFNAGNCR